MRQLRSPHVKNIIKIKRKAYNVNTKETQIQVNILYVRKNDTFTIKQSA